VNHGFRGDNDKIQKFKSHTAKLESVGYHVHLESCEKSAIQSALRELACGHSTATNDTRTWTIKINDQQGGKNKSN